MTTTTRRRSPATTETSNPSLILALAAQIAEMWDVCETIQHAEFKAPPETTEQGRYERSKWDGRDKEVFRRRMALQDAVASLPAETVPEALAQLYLAASIFNYLDASVVEDEVKEAEGRKIEFLINSAMRVLMREHGLSPADIHMSALVGYQLPVTLAGMLEPVEPLEAPMARAAA